MPLISANNMRAISSSDGGRTGGVAFTMVGAATLFVSFFPSILSFFFGADGFRSLFRLFLDLRPRSLFLPRDGRPFLFHDFRRVKHRRDVFRQRRFLSLQVWESTAFSTSVSSLNSSAAPFSSFSLSETPSRSSFNRFSSQSVPLSRFSITFSHRRLHRIKSARSFYPLRL